MPRKSDILDRDGAAPAKASVAPIASSKCAPAVVDNLPSDIPMTARELEALETYLADLLDQLFDEAAAGADNAGE